MADIVHQHCNDRFPHRFQMKARDWMAVRDWFTQQGLKPRFLDVQLFMMDRTFMDDAVAEADILYHSEFMTTYISFKDENVAILFRLHCDIKCSKITD